MISPPTSKNTQGVLKVKQYRFSTYMKANKQTKDYLLEMGASLSDNSYPKIVGVELQKVSEFKCESKEN